MHKLETLNRPVETQRNLHYWHKLLNVSFIDVNIGNWTKVTDKKETVRKSTYIKYLGMPIGETKKMPRVETLIEVFHN